jgi:hypothetical protein
MNIKLKKFNMASIADDKIVVLIGKRETGKSFLTKDLLYYHQDIPVATIVSATEGANQFYSKIVPPLFIHDAYSAPLVDNVCKRQKNLIKKINNDPENVKNIDPRALLLFDDCLFDNSWTKDINVRSLFMNGRHYKIMFIITMQYALGIPPNLRTNIDYVFILREPIVANRKKLYEQYTGMFPTFEIFSQVMDQCTENYECLVINNNAKSNKIEDQVFWYKAESHEDFRIGAPEFWQHAMDNMLINGIDNDEEDFDLSQFKKKKNSLNLTVKKI